MADARPGPSFSKKKKSEFFKLMLGDFEKRLRIPDDFIKHISVELSSRAALEGPSGNCWLVKFSSTETGIYFNDGWETFQRDHSLSFAEFLVFKYTGDMHFKVLIFGVNGCERRDTFVVQPSQGLTFGLGKKCQSTRGDIGKLLSSPRPKKLMPSNEETAYATPQFPSVKCKLPPSYVKCPFTMCLPVKFARKHLPRTSTMVRLQDKKGKTWKMKLTVRPAQSMLCCGWNKFVADKRLKAGDTCRFQLVREAVMKVKIYRC